MTYKQMDMISVADDHLHIIFDAQLVCSLRLNQRHLSDWDTDAASVPHWDRGVAHRTESIR